MWTIFNSGRKTAQANMDLDHELLKKLEPSSRPILHFYEWEGLCASHGYFIQPYEYLNQEGATRQRLQLARRPTGGGIVFHLTDFAFSLLVPASHSGYSVNTLDNYAWVNRKVMEAIEEFSGIKSSLLAGGSDSYPPECRNFCMALPTIFDIIVDGRKVGGAAQRKTKAGFLHQGTISLTVPPRRFLEDVLKAETPFLEEMRKNSYSLLKDESQLEDARCELRRLLSSVFNERAVRV